MMGRAESERRRVIRYGQSWERREASLGVGALDSWERRGSFPWSGWPCRVAGAVIGEGVLDVFID